MKKNANQIFVSHSSKDTKLIDLITLGFKDRKIVPFFAKREMVGENPVEKIINAIDKSMALFALMTPNVVHDNYTRDWVVFEIAVAKVKNVPIFCWIDKGVAENKTCAKLIENITDYDTFDYPYDEECYRVVSSMVEKAFELGGKPPKVVEPTKKELKEGLIPMEEAKDIAVRFVTETKNPTKIYVNSIEPKGDRWIVEGVSVTKTKRRGSSEKWTVEIKGKEILSYRFKPGSSWGLI